MAIYKLDRRVELGSTDKQPELSGQSGIQVLGPNHSATLPPNQTHIASRWDFASNYDNQGVVRCMIFDF